MRMRARRPCQAAACSSVRPIVFMTKRVTGSEASMAPLHQVCVYCGSSDHISPAYLDAARAMGQTLARRGIRLVFGGGKQGMMGALADAALAAGGEVIGVIAEVFNTAEQGHPGGTN